uniref:Uncharacterized protein n=1 Tax=viral metagenome TaxID=1070528 RepID=A0A6M3LPJ2_9ZZZZ
MKSWNRSTLYEDHPVFGIGMSGWHTYEYWKHREDYDIELAAKWSISSDYTHAIENLDIW